MTLSPWLVYLWGIVDDLRPALKFLAALFVVAACSNIFFGLVKDCDDFTLNKKVVIPTLLAAICCGFLSILVPSSKTLAIMVVAPAIVNSEPIQKDLPELYSIGIQALKEKLKEGAPEIPLEKTAAPTK